MIWAFAKLQWDTSRDIDVLLNEFYEKMFGKAAATMAAYYALLERAWNTPRPGRSNDMLVVSRNAAQQCLAISPHEIEAGLELLDQALQEADDDRVRKRIEIVRSALRFSQYGIESYLLSQTLRATRIQSAATAQEVLEALADYGPSILRRKLFWTQAKARNDLLGETLRGLDEMKHYLMTDTFGQIDSSLVSVAMDLVDWYRNNEPGQLPKVQQALANRSLPESIRVAVDASVKSYGAENLLRNADFEAVRPGAGRGRAG